jgi:O-antigen/teichoic acid export membrane protein
MNRRRILLDLITSTFFRVGAAVIALVMTLLVTRTLSPEEAGVFLLIYTLLSVCSIFFRLGLDNVVLRKISAKEGEGKGLHSLTTGIQWILVSSLPVSAVTSFFAQNIATDLLSKPDFGPVLQVAIWALPVMATFMLLAMGFQAVHRIIATTFFQNLGVSFLFIIGFCTVWFFNPGGLSAITAAYIYLASAVIILIIALLMWHKQVGGDWGQPKFKDPELWQASSNLWAATSMSLAVQWSAILMAGFFVASHEIAYLSAAQRTASLTSFVLMVVNMVVAPHYARLWHEDKAHEIERLAKLSTRGMLALVFPVVAVLLLFPDSIMGMFGKGYEQGAILLSIIAVGQFINVATGSVGYLLTMSGHERDYRRVTFFAGPLTIILSYLLIQEYGVLGAAIATAIGLSVQNISALFMVRKRLGFWPIG